MGRRTLVAAPPLRRVRATVVLAFLMLGIGNFSSPSAAAPTESGGSSVSARASCTTPTDIFSNPFNRRSAHHRPVGAGADYAGATAPSTLSWLENSSQSVNINIGAPWGVSVATTDASDPVMTIGTVSLDCDRIVGLPTSIRLPKEGFITPIRMKRGCTDGVVVIYDGSEEVVHQIRQYNWNDGAPVGGQYKTWDIRGLGHGTRPGDRIGTSASGIAALFGVLRGDEVNEPGRRIEHALQMALPRKPGDCAMMLSREVVLPAVSGDGSMNRPENNLGNIPYGALMALPPPSKGGPDLDNLGLTERGKRLAEAVRDYGIYVVDGGACAALRADQYVRQPAELKAALSAIYPYVRMILNNDVLGSETAGGGDARAPNCAFDAR